MLLRKIKANWLYIVVFSTFCYSSIELGVLLLTLLYLIRHSLVKAPHVLVYLTLFFAYSVVVATTILGYPMSKGLQQYGLLTLYILIYYILQLTFSFLNNITYIFSVIVNIFLKYRKFNSFFRIKINMQ